MANTILSMLVSYSLSEVIEKAHHSWDSITFLIICMSQRVTNDYVY